MQWKHNMEIVYNSVNTVTYLFHREWDLHVKHLSWPNQKSPTGNNRKHLQLKAKYSSCYYWLVPPIDNDLYAHSTIIWLNISNSQAYYMVAGGSELELQSWPSFKAFPITPP